MDMGCFRSCYDEGRKGYPEMTPQINLPHGIRSRFVPEINGLDMHVLEAGFETPGNPLVLLLHGFPELAYSWRKVMLPLAAAGYHVVVRDQVGLAAALGHKSVEMLVGHDFGSPVAAWCALVRPDIFRSVALMSAP